MRATEFIHFINIDAKKLKLGHNMKGDDYTHLTIRMKIKRARYEHQMALRKEERDERKRKSSSIRRTDKKIL